MSDYQTTGFEILAVTPVIGIGILRGSLATLQNQPENRANHRLIALSATAQLVWTLLIGIALGGML